MLIRDGFKECGIDVYLLGVINVALGDKDHLYKG